MQNLLAELETLLAQDETLIGEDGRPIKSEVNMRATKLDPALLRLLLSNDRIRAEFFADVDGIMVFDKSRFQTFVANKEFLPDSYTAFRNTIGLTGRDGRFLKDSQDVVLAWPYKDCVLEGGMTKEDAKRDEIFWNTTLAPDDITRLFEPKVLTNFERWDAEALAAGKAKPVEVIDPDNDNLLIKGNNLLALHSLKARYAGKVKLIYIDPPYNTGDDEFRYNDNFNRSSWLTFMKSRLQTAKQILEPNGFIAIQINDIEQAYLKVLLDEVFDYCHFSTVCVKMSHLSGPKMAHKETTIPKIKEYIHIYRRKGVKSKINPQYVEVSWDDAFDRYGSFIDKHDSDDISKWSVLPLRQALAKNGLDSSDQTGQESFLIANAHCIFQTALNRGADIPAEPRNSLFLHNGKLCLNGREVLLASDKIRKFNGVDRPSSVVGDIWNDIGINNVFQEGGEGIDLRFGKKPEQLLLRLIDTFTNRGDLVCDFFAGTATTVAVAHKAGRRWLAVEQLDYIERLSKQRLKNVIAGDGTGVSGLCQWKGGGQFVYAELAEWNEAFGQRIRDAADDKALGQVTADIRTNGYWRYAVDQSLWNWDAFAALDFDARKQLLLDSLDANHLYVNLGDIDDETFGISDADKAVNKAFYEGGA